MATESIIIIDLKTDNFLDTITKSYQQFINQGATTVELHVTHNNDEPAGYEINIVANVPAPKSNDPVCPKPCTKCRKQ
ncbi:MAG: hypothetical protein JWQ40_749 [Segetibacter sp.]|jgi:hypothetical protein|nr:hypothetical protein [Segetibacter sp.]